MKESDFWRCEDCGSNNVRFNIYCLVSFPSKWDKKLTKERLLSKECTFWGVSWDCSEEICENCGKNQPYIRKYIYEEIEESHPEVVVENKGIKRCSCGCEDFKIMTYVKANIPSIFTNNLTSKNKRSKEFKIIRVNYNRSDYICEKCGNKVIDGTKKYKQFF